MKKHDEGYALVLVLVVVLVLNIAAVGLMTLTLNNLKTQRNLVDRMVDKYAAQGEIEKVVAQLSCPVDEFTVAAGKTLKEELTAWVKEKCNANPIGADFKDNIYSCKVTITKEKNKAKVQCELYLEIRVEDKNPSEQEFGEKHYKLTPETLQYKSYQYTSGGDS